MIQEKYHLEKEREENKQNPLINIIPNHHIIEEMPADKLQKNFVLEQYPNIRVEAGTVNRHTLKACFLEIKGTFETFGDEPMSTMNSVIRNISRTINSNINLDLFRKEFISTPNISDSFVFTGKSYTKLEYTFFIKRATTYEEITNELNILTKKIHEENIIDSDKIKFHRELISKRVYK